MRTLGGYWMRMAAETFAKDFDPQVLAKLQEVLDKDKITKAIADVSKQSGIRGVEPTITPLAGGAKRSPELTIKTRGTEKSGVAFLLAPKQQLQRRWLLEGASEVNIVLQPGTYTVYIGVKDGKGGATKSVYRSTVKIEFKKKYLYEVP